MTQSSGYFFVASKSAGLISTPSMVVPSRLFQEMTSRVPRMNELACSERFVSRRGEKLRTEETKTSFMLFGEPATKAIRSPARVKENDPAIRLSGLEMRITLPLEGSTRNR